MCDILQLYDQIFHMNNNSHEKYTTRKKDIGEGHACDGPLRFVTNVTYGDVP